MSCDNSTCHIDLCSSAKLVPCDRATASGPDVERPKSLKQGQPGLAADQSKAKGHRHEGHSRIIPDSTETDPVYVWGDEGPIND